MTQTKNLSKQSIAQAFSPQILVDCLETVDSTSTEIRRRLAHTDSPMLITAEAQTAGRGRRGRNFFSPRGTGLYMSIYMPVEEKNLVLLTSGAAVAVCRALQRETGLQAGIKWVNDIILNGKKIAGILCERTQNGVIIGVGINLTTSHFPPEIAERAGNLFSAKIPSCIDSQSPVSEITPNKTALCIAVAKELFALARGAENCMEEYRNRLVLYGKEIIFEENGISRCGTVKGVDNTGGLIVETHAETLILRSGEITVREKE